MSAPELLWESGESRMESLQSGYIVTRSRGLKIRLFTINHSISPKQKSFILRSTLPGYSKDREVDSVEDGKKLALMIVARFRAVMNGEDR